MYKLTENGFFASEARGVYYDFEILGVVVVIDEIDGRKLCSVIKHGEAKRVKEYYGKHKSTYSSLDLGELRYFECTSDKVDLDEFNFFLESSAQPLSRLKCLEVITE